MYKGSRLQDLCKQERGLASTLSKFVFGKNKGIERYYKDGLNVTIETLEKIAVGTHHSVEYFLDYKRPDNASPNSTIYGDNNIVNSPNTNNALEKIDNLKKEIALKDEIIKSDRELISAKDEIIKTLKERLNDSIRLMQEMGKDKSQTK